MLKWTKKDESKSMSGAVKKRATAPPGSTPMSSDAATKRGVSQNGSTATSPTLTYPAEASDDVNMNEVDGLVSLDVTLPTGQRTDISVDYNTPMLDLLVCLAGKSKLNPTGLTLQLVSEDTGKPMGYKPNQTIGSLGGRVVKLISKEELTAKTKSKTSKKDKPFEMTHRFTINLPRAQKTVVRVSPLTTLGDLVTSVCQEKNLDMRRHVLQIPGKPGVPVDLGATIQQIGVHEMNLIAVGLQERNHTVSMPDLSKPPPYSDPPPTYMPSAGEHKKKRGFLSFLSKSKDKKYKPHDARYSMETSSTTSHMMSTAQARKPTTPPSAQRRVSDTEKPSARPKSMFVASTHTAQKEDMDTSHGENMQSVTAPARKKRRAPAPPAPTNSQPPSKPMPSSLEISVKSDKDSKDNTSAKQNTHNMPAPAIANQREDVVAAPAVSSQQVSRAEMLSRLHSRNSSDSSGYHELTLSGCESPEAAHLGVPKHKNSIDATSIESTDNANGDSGIHESPIRVSPIEEVQEKSEVNSVASAASPGNTDTLTSKKRRKAPAPPAPTPTPSLSSTITTTITATTTTANTDSATKADTTAKKDSVPIVSKQTDLPPSQPEEPPKPSSTSQKQEVQPPLSSKEEKKEDKPESKTQVDDPYLVGIGKDTNESEAFDIHEILEGVVFDEEPKSMELRIAYDDRSEDQDKDAMMMVETSSVTSENIEQMDVPSRSERPCAFIPPPPPSEPPPPEQPVVDIKSLTSDIAPMLVDKGTEVNDDNTSLAPSSAKSSPGTVSAGYKSEMALFVERMSKMAVESTEEAENAHLDDSVSSVSIPGSDNNSDTGSVIQHLHTDSRSGSESGSLTRKEGVKISSDISELKGTFQDHPDELQESEGTNFAMSEEISVPVETVPPPPEFGDKGSNNDAEEQEEEEEEEYFFSETVEELIIPLGPDGLPDFYAARKAPESETVKNEIVKEQAEQPSRETERRGSTGVFRAEPVAVSPVSNAPTPIFQSQPKPAKLAQPPAPPKPVEKEEFVLTTEDLSNVSFLPPKPQLAKPYVNPEPTVHVSSTSLLMEKSAHPITSSSNRAKHSEKGNKVSTMSFIPHTETENDSMMEEKPTTLLNLPSMRPNTRSDNAPAFSDDDHSDTSNDPLLTKQIPHLLMNSHNSYNSGTRKISNDGGGSNRTNDSSHRSSFDNGADADISGNLERPGSRASAYSLDTQEQQEALQAQYYSLQAQFSQWQEQLARNQNLLASQAIGPELQAEQLQQLTDQMAMQQQMMQQLQSTMLALQQQQQMQGSGQEHRASSGELPARVPEPAAAAAEPAPVVAAAPPPPPPPAPAPQPTRAVKADNNKARPKPKSRFEPELDPREQLMIAIRSFKREDMRSVPIQKTKWVQSNK